jgi:hypothetical protein
MCVLLKSSTQTAKKAYDCDACIWIREAGNWDWMTFAERRLVVKARQKDWKILPGEKYLYQFLVEDGDKWSFRAIPEMHDICLKYDCYPEC